MRQFSNSIFLSCSSIQIVFIKYFYLYTVNFYIADVDPMYSIGSIDRTKLPTAPKASRGPEDLSKIPTDPPFTAYIGNLPYEVTEEKVAEFFNKLPVHDVYYYATAVECGQCTIKIKINN